MVPAVLTATTNTLFRKYRPTCAVFHASTYVWKENDSGSANGWPRKISVLVLNDDSSTQISGPAVASAQTNSAMCASPLKAFTSRLTSGLRPAEVTGTAGASITSLIVASQLDGVAPGDPQGQRGERQGQDEQRHAERRGVPGLGELEGVAIDHQAQHRGRAVRAAALHAHD